MTVLLVILAKGPGPFIPDGDWKSYEYFFLFGFNSNQFHFPGLSTVIEDCTAASQSPLLYKAADLLGIFCLLSSECPLAPLRQNLVSKLGTDVQCRIYDPLSAVEELRLNVDKPHFLVMNAMTPHPDADETFNDWYQEEHIPMLSRVPGWLASRRFSLSMATGNAPHYLALHEWRDEEAFEAQEYKVAIDTPWKWRVIAQVIEKERFVLKYEGKLEDYMYIR